MDPATAPTTGAAGRATAANASARAIAGQVATLLAERASPERAEQERRYLKSDLTHLGVSVPVIAKVARTVQRDHPELDHDGLVATVDVLWGEGIHEHRMAAVELLELALARLSIEDAPLLERLLRSSRTWALVDGLAVGVVGRLVLRDPAWDPVVRRWARDDDHWIRRSSLLAHLPGIRADGSGFERFGELADPMLADTGFFVRKAIGWVLREAGKRQPELVTAWLLPRAGRAAGLTVREAVKYLPEEDRSRITAARDAAPRARGRGD